MSKGRDLTQGSQGKNFDFQFNLLKAIGLLIESSPTGALALEATLQSVLAGQNTVIANVTSKMERIKGSANYSRALTYHGATANVIQIVHTGTTLLGAEQITETITYVDPAVANSNVTSIVYS